MLKVWRSIWRVFSLWCCGVFDCSVIKFSTVRPNWKKIFCLMILSRRRLIGVVIGTGRLILTRWVGFKSLVCFPFCFPLIRPFSSGFLLAFSFYIFPSLPFNYFFIGCRSMTLYDIKRNWDDFEIWICF